MTEVEPNGEQLAQLLAINSDLLFGKFTWLPERKSVNLSYEMLGDSLDKDELATALGVVGRLADEWDEPLREVLGGRLPHGD